ncbi:Cyclin-dependent kinase B1-1 [Zea mays]|uniref:[RNA-polymerase]-subunit kinase n=1 Tax=Zea mays TaxID=4577 RepID=A0A1D6NL37_MAIZE|nr:Putative cyclin-dependent protein kinase family protein [Zea mays]ONM40942.1 Cyclin-dependent kinase B1-1 [Zea mays]
MVVEISNLYQVAMLVNDLCRSKSVNDLSSPSCQTHKDDDNNNLEDEDEWQDGKKFDAVATFKILSEVEFSLSVSSIPLQWHNQTLCTTRCLCGCVTRVYMTQLMDLTMALKITDLGLSRAIIVPVKKYTHEILTLWYRAPEPLFPGDSELQRLLHIFKLLGTPNEEMWPGVGKLPNWHVYPQWKPTKLSTLVPGLDSDGYDLLEKMLAYEPGKRVSAKKALEHPYFNDVNKEVY